MKSNIKRFVIILAIIMAASFIVAAAVFFATGGLSVTGIASNSVQDSRSYDIQGIKSIEVQTVSSDIKVMASEGNEIEVSFFGEVSSNLKNQMPQLKTQVKGSSLEVYIDHPKAITVGIFSFMELDLEVYLPQDYSGDVKISTTSGKLSITGLCLEDFSFKGVSGAVSLKGLCADNIDIRSTSGRLDLEDITGSIKAANLSGDIDIGLKELVGDLDAESISGSVKVQVPKGSGFVFDAESVSGSIEYDFEAKIDFADKNNLEATVGDGKYDIAIKTTSGNISIEKK